MIWLTVRSETNVEGQYCRDEGDLRFLTIINVKSQAKWFISQNNILKSTQEEVKKIEKKKEEKTVIKDHRLWRHVKRKIYT